MAVVGEAYVVVRAMTNKLDGDIQKAFQGSSRTMERQGRRLGETFSQSFSRGFNSNQGVGSLRRFSIGLQAAVRDAEAARNAFRSLIITGYSLGTALGSAVAGVGSLVISLGSIIGAAGGAAASLAVVTNGVFAFIAAMAVAKLALGGVGKAVSALNKGAGGGAGGVARNIEEAQERIEDAQKALARVIERNNEALVEANNEVRISQIRLNEAFREGREEIQQLGFDAEDAALAEQQAAIALEKAREELALAQDLPPNSRVRREAELSYQEAELNYRRTKDRAADLADEQDRLARTGVAGTEVVIDATNALAEAEANRTKVVRDGIRAQEDAEEALEDARKAAAKPQGGGGGGGGGNNPFEGLNEAQITFAKFIASLKPQFDELKRIAAESFLPPLQQAITTLMTKAFPTVAKGIGTVGTALGVAVNHLANAITTAENLKDLDKAFEQSAFVLEGLGKTIGNLWGAFLSIISAATPITERFVSFLEEKTGIFDRFLNTEQASGRLEEFFNRSGDLMSDFGEIIGNIFGGFGRLIALNFGPDSGGQILLDWLKDSTERFSNLGRGVDDQARHFQNFQDAAKNTIDILNSIGGLLGAIGSAATNRSLGETFRVLGTGVGYVRQLMNAFVDSGPALAGLIVQLTEFVAKTTDTGAMATFFEILAGALNVINDIMDNEIIAGFVAWLGILTAVGLAFGVLVRQVLFFGKVITGVLISATRAAGTLQDTLAGRNGVGAGFQNATTKVGGLRGALRGLGSALGGPVAIGLTALAIGAQLAVDKVDELEKKITSAGLNVAKAGGSIEDVWKAVSRSNAENFAWVGATETKLENLNGALKTSGEEWKKGFGWRGSTFDKDVNATLKTVKDFGDTLAEVATTDLPSAQNQFKGLAAQTDGSNKRLWELLSNMPKYKEALEEQATQLGININTGDDALDKQRLLNLAMGEGSTEATELAVSYSDLGRTQRTLNSDARSYEATLDSITASIAEQKTAYQEANGTLDGFKASMDISTEAGRENQAMIDELAGATQALSEATFEQTGDQAEANRVILEGRDALVDQMIQMGYTKDEAVAYADKLGLIPKQISTKMYLDTAEASWRLDTWLKNANNNITAALSGARYSGMAAAMGGAGANGMLKDHRNPIKSFANGGFPTGFYSGGTPLYKFAEQETGWEAFISGRRGQEKRNAEIANEALDRLGAPRAGAGAGTTISIQVVTQPGQDNMEIAQEVSRIIAFEQRKGKAEF